MASGGCVWTSRNPAISRLPRASVPMSTNAGVNFWLDFASRDVFEAAVVASLIVPRRYG